METQTQPQTNEVEGISAYDSSVALVRNPNWKDVTIGDKTYKPWRGILMYTNKPFVAVSGLESRSMFLDDDGNKRFSTSILLSSDISKEEKTAGHTAERYCAVDLIDFVNKDNEEKVMGLVKKCDIFGMNFPMKGYINHTEGWDTLKLWCSKEQVEDITDPEKGGKNYIKHGKPIPVFTTSHPYPKERMMEVLEAFAADHPNFQAWYAKYFPGSSEPFVKAAAKLADFKKELEAFAAKATPIKPEEELDWDQ